MIDAILLSGSRATNMVTPFSDWDYNIFTDDFIDFYRIRDILRKKHYPTETHVNWGNEKTDDELFRSLCFNKLYYSRKNYYWELMRRVYPVGVFPTYEESQIMVAKGRMDNVRLFHEEENDRVVRLITINLAHQRAKMLKWEMPANKDDLVSEVKNWKDEESVFAFAKKCVEDISNCNVNFNIKLFIGFQRSMLRRSAKKKICWEGNIRHKHLGRIYPL